MRFDRSQESGKVAWVRGLQCKKRACRLRICDSKTELYSSNVITSPTLDSDACTVPIPLRLLSVASLLHLGELFANSAGDTLFSLTLSALPLACL